MKPRSRSPSDARSQSPSESTFHYLCPRHQAWVALDCPGARSLWHDAMEKGQAASQAGGLQRARLFFGSAFETAVIRMRQCITECEDLNVLHLAETGRLLSQTLCELRELEEAEQVLSLVHSSLLVGIDRPPPDNVSPGQYLDLVEEILGRLAGVMTRLGRTDGARMRALLTCRVVENQRAGMAH